MARIATTGVARKSALAAIATGCRIALGVVACASVVSERQFASGDGFFSFYGVERGAELLAGRDI